MGIEYKKLELSDYDFISKMVKDNLGEVITESFNGYFNYVLFFNRALESGSAYVIFHDDAPCGFLWFSLKSNRLHVNTIIIDATHQGKGIGKLIFTELEKKARESNIPFMQLGVQGSNQKARELYKKLGFLDIGYIDEFDTYYMEKKVQN